MKNILNVGYLLICLFAYLLITPIAFAHILQTDGTIGAVMHIDPNDDPIAQEQASFFFAFKDTTNKFSPKNCSCKIEIIESDKTIYAQPLFQNSSTPTLDSASLFYTFPTPDVYQVVITGMPLIRGAFQNFKLTYNVRVEQNISSSPTPASNFFTTHSIHFVIAIVMIIFVVFVIVQKIRERKDVSTNPKKSTK